MAHDPVFARESSRWIALAATVGAVALAAAYHYREIHDDLTAVALERKESVARLAATVLAEKFGRVEDIAVSLATRVRFAELVSAGRWDEAMAIMQTVPQDVPRMERLFLVDVDGVLRADIPALPGVRGRNFSHRDWYKGALRTDRTHVSSIYTRTAPPQVEVVAIAVPVKDRDGRITGILVLQIRVERLLEWVEAIDLADAERIYLVDPQGRHAFHDVPAGGQPIGNGRLSGHHGAGIFDGEILAFAAVPGYGWKVVTHEPARLSGVLATRDEQLRKLLSGYVTIFALVAAAFVLSTRIGAERRRAEQRFRAVTETANDAVVSADRHGNIVYFNPAAECMFGHTADEAASQPLTMLMPERFHLAHQEGMRRFVAGGEPRVVGKTTELTGRRRDGSEFPLELSLAAWMDGDQYNFTGIIREISERKLAQEALHRYSAELRAVNQELEAFSYSVSHDLRGPLRAIDGFSNALGKELGDDISESAKGYFSRIRAGVKRMGQLIDDLLALAKVSRDELQPTELDLSAITEQVVNDLRNANPDRIVDVSIWKEIKVVGDVRLVRAMMENLIGNAWKFTTHTDKARIEIGTMRDQELTVIFIRDNGAGFDMKYADKLFGAFQRLHTSNEFAGTGIGLATVQRIVHRHGGRIWADSTPGNGAVFYFTFNAEDDGGALGA